MKILLDMNLPPIWAPYLESDGHEVQHWINIGANDAPDSEIMEWARKNGFIVFTHDLDFGALLYATKATAPSVIQLRIEDIRPQSVGKLVLNAISKASDEINRGALVTIDPRKKRVRLLPLR